MWSPGSGPQLRLYPRPSGRLAAALIVTHLAAAGMPAAAGLPWYVTATAVPVIAASLLRHLRRDAWLLSRDSVTALIVDEGRLQLVLPETGPISATPVPPLVVSAGLVLLNLRLDGGGRRALALTSDALDPEGHRRLRARLNAGL